MKSCEWLETYQETTERDRRLAVDAEARGDDHLAEALKAEALGRDFVASRISRLLQTGASIMGLAS